MFLHDYYASAFPAETVASILNLSPLDRMEVALRGRTTNGTDFFTRYNSAANAADLRRLATQPNIREVHFGGFYVERVSKAHCSRNAAVARPLVIDVDLQDYLPVQKIGVSKDDLDKCDAFLPLVLLGMEVLKVALTDAFGFESFVCFYSGRRGAHLLALDKRAFELTEQARSAIAASLSVKGGSVPLHSFPSYSRAVDLLMDEFGSLPLLEDDSYASSFVQRMNIKKSAFVDFENEVVGREGAAERWKHIRRRVEAGDEWMLCMLRRMVVEDVWPPIDAAVTATIGHLAKAPFSVHASTGRVAVALPDKCTEFDPSACPSLSNLDGLQKNAASVSTKIAVRDMDTW